MKTINSSKRLGTTRSLVLGLGLAAGLPVLVPAAQARAASSEAAAVKPDMKKVTQHLEQHQTYPATRAELLASCKNLVDFSAGEKRWFAERLPEGTYGSAADVLKALGRK